MSAYTVYTDPLQATPANQSAIQTQREIGWNVLDQLRHNPPGYWTGNKYQQSQHDLGTVYIAIRAVMDVMHQAKVGLGRRKRSTGKRTLTPGKLIKSVSAEPGTAADEMYQPVNDHPVMQRIEKPNPVDTFGQLMSYMVLQNRLTGVAPLWCLPNENKKPVELYALPTALTTPQWQKTPEFPTGAWRVQPFYATGGLGFLPSPYAGTGVIVPNDEIARFMDPHPLFRWDGKAPLDAGAFQLDVLEEIDQARWAAFDHGVTMDAVLQVDGFDDAQIKRLESKMEQKHQGTANHRRFLILSGQMGTEKTRLHSFSQSPREMDFKDSWEQMVGFVLALFGVPKSVAGLAMASNYSELYAALRQFYVRQKAYAFRMSEFLTKALAWPYCKFPGEYRITIDLPALDDPELQEKQLATDLQYDTILYNEARTLRNRPRVPGGDVPVSIYVKGKTQELAPDPEPAPMPGMDPMAGGDEMGQGDEQDGAGGEQAVQDDIVNEAMEQIGVPAESSGMKAVPFNEAKHKRQGGKFSQSASNKPVTSSDPTRRGYSSPSSPNRIGGAGRKAADHAKTPEGMAVLQRAKVWAAQMAEKHADRVAAHLGVDRKTAAHILRTTIEQLCQNALSGGDTSKQYTGKTGNRLTIGVKRKSGQRPDTGPTAGATPRPENKAGKGSRVPMAKKAMSSVQCGLGAELVPAAGNGKLIALKRPGKRKRVPMLDRIMKAIT